MSNVKQKKLLITFILLIVAVLLGLGCFMLFNSMFSNHKYIADYDTSKELSESANIPVFSADSGFYEEEFLLSISSENGEIYYTLDGTDPATNPRSAKYNKSIKIYNNSYDSNKYSAEKDITLGYYRAPHYRVDKGIILRAAVKDADGKFGETVTRSYFVGKNKDYYMNMRVISLVTNPYNLFDKEEGIYVVGNSYYRWKKSADYEPTWEDWRLENPTNYNNKGEEWERPALIQIFEEGNLVHEQEIGIRLSGNVSRSNAQKSIRFFAREEYGDKKIKYSFFDDLKDANGEPVKKFDKVTLRNEGNDSTSSFFRDELVQSLCSNLDVGIQAEAPCILFIDGEFWGMYHIKERIDENYISSHYDIKKENVTYVKRAETSGSEEIRQQYEDFYNWAMSADFTQEENYKRVTDTIDIQSLMDYFAIETYINNYDWLNADRSPNNILMWRVNEPLDGNRYADGRWRFVLYDMEYSSGLYGQEGTQPEYNSFDNISKTNNWANPGALFFRLLDNESFRAEFYSNYLRIMEENFDPERVATWIDEYLLQNGEAIADTFERYSIGNGSGHLSYHADEVEKFYTARPEYAKKYLESLIYN